MWRSSDPDSKFDFLDIDEAIERRSEDLADRADELASLGFYVVDDYDPDDREPMAGDPLWRDDGIEW